MAKVALMDKVALIKPEGEGVFCLKRKGEHELIHISGTILPRMIITKDATVDVSENDTIIKRVPGKPENKFLVLTSTLWDEGAPSYHLKVIRIPNW